VARAFEGEIGARLGLSAQEAAYAALTIANNKMAAAIRMVSLSMGHDPRDFALFAFGGAGPLHACDVARELGVERVVIPARPGLTNALGCVVADLRHDFVQSINTPLGQLSLDDLHGLLARQAASGHELIAAQPVAIEALSTTHVLEMQFVGQTHVIKVPMPSGTPSLDEIKTRFEAAYFERFRLSLDHVEPVIVTVATSVTARRADVDLAALLPDPPQTPTVPITREVWFDGGPVETPIYWRDDLPRDLAISGPAIIEQLDSTIVLPPECRARGDDLGNLIVEV